MIQAQELRLGNYVKDIQYMDRLCTVRGIYEDQIEVSLPTGISFYSEPKELEPIPLTEELLIKLGFEDWSNKDGSKRYVLHNILDGTSNFEIRTDGDGYYYYVDNDIIETSIADNLHELQNLFFVISNKQELTLDNNG